MRRRPGALMASQSLMRSFHLQGDIGEIYERHLQDGSYGYGLPYVRLRGEDPAKQGAGASAIGGTDIDDEVVQRRSGDRALKGARRTGSNWGMA